MKLEFAAMICRFGKISNNVPGQQDITEFTIPISGIMLDKEQLNTLTGDPMTWDSWFVTELGKAPKPCAWWALGDGEFKIAESYDSKRCVIEVSGERIIEFTFKKGEGDEDDVPASRLKNGVLIARMGGLTEFLFSLHVRPGRGKNNLLLQDHQYREVKLSIFDSAVTKEKSKQQELPLCPFPVGGLPSPAIPKGEEPEESRIAESSSGEPTQSAPTAEVPSETRMDVGSGGDGEAQSIASSAQGDATQASTEEDLARMGAVFGAPIAPPYDLGPLGDAELIHESATVAGHLQTQAQSTRGAEDCLIAPATVADTKFGGTGADVLTTESSSISEDSGSAAVPIDSLKQRAARDRALMRSESLEDFERRIAGEIEGSKRRRGVINGRSK